MFEITRILNSNDDVVSVTDFVIVKTNKEDKFVVDVTSMIAIPPGIYTVYYIDGLIGESAFEMATA